MKKLSVTGLVKSFKKRKVVDGETGPDSMLFCRLRQCRAGASCERTNQGRYCQGRTPLQTFLDGMELYQKYVYENPVSKRRR